VNGVSDHGGGRAENDVKKSHHGGVKREVAAVSLLVTSGGLWNRTKAEVGRMKWRLEVGLLRLFEF
jgi:hypothetical protein